MSKFCAVVAGAGSGTGASVALHFAKTYPVVLLARKPASYEQIVQEIRAAGGSAHGYTADVSDPASIDGAFAQIDRDLRGHKLAAAVYNANAGFAYKPFLELKIDDLDASLGAAANGLFYFAQKTLPRLLDAVSSSPHPPSLIVTGATASVRGAAKFTTFAAGKFAQRAITQSLAREFGPQGVHVALAIIDGVIDVPWAKERTANNGVADGKIAAEAIAQSYWHLHTQPRSAFTHELDIRPYVEKF
ncbi:short chain dehydrogenase [Metarhizium album ARSEF 1941]|uniref:Short chain dehydrogenase n=1 Tax=Metarhizium album (strain ARSEF 1941) TaxID=1081103 RepID=A0A0B2WUM7_METAS|nr:short chain dehydrogenase [Metarhizium album ARSEF 1941]KHN97768.1 short chain dehydrogenase [Metarhizium album ARSEF 1941]